jgi:hypothetical protein
MGPFTVEWCIIIDDLSFSKYCHLSEENLIAAFYFYVEKGPAADVTDVPQP